MPLNKETKSNQTKLNQLSMLKQGSFFQNFLLEEQ